MKSKLKTLLRKGNILAPPDVTNLKEFLNKLSEQVSPSSVSHIEASSEGPVHSIILIGFHHKKGSIVEYKYPSEKEESDLLPYLALPDCIHNESSDFLYFLVQIGGKLKYCVSCFRQVPNENISADMSRNYVQKALVAISNLPFFGIISSRMQATTHAYFEQKNFENTEIITDIYNSLTSGLESCGVSDLYVGFSARKLIHMFKEKVMMLWKLVLLEGRIVIYSKKPSQLSSAVFALLSLFPGQLCFDADSKIYEKYLKSLKMYGLPLELFNENFVVHPYFSIFQLDALEKPGYLIGCTNQMIVEHPKTQAHAVLNIEENKLDILLPKKSAKCIKLNSHDKTFMKSIIKKVDETWNENEDWFGSDTLVWAGSDDFIRSEFHMYLKNNLANIALLREKLIGDSDLKDIPSLPDFDEPSECEANANILKKPKKKSKYQNLDPRLNKLWKFKKYMKSFRMSFLYRWSSTYNFNQWMKNYPSFLASLSSFSNYTARIKISYENGDVYTGSVLSGKKEDHGILEESNGNRYEGHWISDQRSGMGTYTTQDNQYVYDGEWLDDEKSGNGREIDHGVQYSGGFSKNLYNGYGVYIDPEGNMYDGDWLGGKKSGVGHFKNSIGDSYSGEFCEGEFHGQGQITFANGDVYVGMWKLGKQHGIGELITKGQESFRGEFYEGKLHGRISITKKNGCRVDCNYFEGEMNKGSVEIYYDDGRVYQGSVDEELKPHGKGVMHMPSGIFVAADWEHGDRLISSNDL
ncbi:AVL9 [Blepharisma stoltei]|uniref:UDENN domain-containing protein n=1 Tax=Blepharisma stoltei TaxID=1481888 RepID=A0AAU9J7Q7_9CILI|nr:unnamed protein product [Blepharisma stoltei]